jgi:hypothetical protein
MTNDKQIEKRFIKSSLEQTAKKISADVYKKTASFRSTFWKANSFSSSDDTMVYNHSIKNRFVDMRTRNKQGVKVKKKSHVVHNRIVMGNYSGLVRELSFGFTEEIKQKFRNMQP